MRKRRIAVELFAMMIAVTGVFHGSMNVNAATKKITVDQTYENATKIKGKTKKGCVVKVKIGKKTYQSKVNKKGNYSVKVSKLVAMLMQDIYLIDNLYAYFIKKLIKKGEIKVVKIDNNRFFDNIIELV